MIDWMRAYNQTVPEERKVRFHVFDIMSNAVGRAAVLDYFRRVAPEKASETEFIFAVHGIEEARRQTPDSIVRGHLLRRLDELEAYLNRERVSLVERSSAAELDRMLHFIRNMKPSIGSGRTEAMVENLVHVIEHERPDTKFVLWAYDGYMGHDAPIGSRMLEAFGEQYYAVGFVFHQGSYQTRVVVPGEPAGDFRAAVAPAAPVGSLSWQFSRAEIGNFFLDFRGAMPGDSAVQEWLATPQVRWLNGWVYGEPRLSTGNVPRDVFDGMIFVETTTPTRPTPNALKSVANRLRL